LPTLHARIDRSSNTYRTLSFLPNHLSTGFLKYPFLFLFPHLDPYSLLVTLVSFFPTAISTTTFSLFFFHSLPPYWCPSYRIAHCYYTRPSSGIENPYVRQPSSSGTSHQGIVAACSVTYTLLVPSSSPTLLQHTLSATATRFFSTLLWPPWFLSFYHRLGSFRLPSQGKRKERKSRFS
jgi:hypothetical protein